jgi:hypothetical protein
MLALSPRVLARNRRWESRTPNNLRFRWLWMELNSYRSRRSFCGITFCHLRKPAFTMHRRNWLGQFPLDATLIVQEDERQWIPDQLLPLMAHGATDTRQGKVWSAISISQVRGM